VTNAATSTVAKAAFHGMRERGSPPPPNRRRHHGNGAGAVGGARRRCRCRRCRCRLRGQVVRHLQDRIARVRLRQRIAVGRMVERAAQRRVAQIVAVGIVEPGAVAAHARCSSTDR
jgi:hypothetical protein